MRIVFFFILAFVTSFCNAQFGNNHSQSSPNTLETFLGGVKINRGLINTIYVDTTTANLQPIKNYPAAQIWVNDTVYVRDATATKWMAIGSGGGGSGTVTNVLTTNGLGILSSVATSTTTPNITISVDTSSASILSRQRAANTYALIGSTLASQGNRISGDTVVFAGPIGTPGIFTNERTINTNRFIMHWTNGKAAEAGGELWHHSYRPYSPFQFISYDTVPGDNQLQSMARPLSSTFARRVIHFPVGTYKIQQSYGHYFGQTYDWLDSFVVRTDGMDYSQAFTAEQFYNPRGSGYQVVKVGFGTNNELKKLHGSGTLLSNIYVGNKDGASTDTTHVRGTLIGVISYLVSAPAVGKNILDEVVYFQNGNLVNSNTRIKRSVWGARQLDEAQTDTAYFVWDTLTKSKTLLQNLVVGKGDSTQSAFQFKVYGTSMFNSQFAGYWANVAANYTARSFTDKNYVDSLVGTVGGNTIYTGDGTLSGARVVSLNSNDLRFLNGSNFGLWLKPLDQAMTFRNESGTIVFNIGDDYSGYQLTATGLTAAYTATTHTFNGAVRIVDGTQQNGYVFTSDASGNGSWQPASGGSGITIGTTTITSGTNTRVLFNNSGVVGEYTISGSGNVAMTTSPVFTTPDLGTPSALVLTNATGLPVGSVTGLGTGVATWLATPSSSNFASAITGETGTGAVVFGTSPTFTTSILLAGATSGTVTLNSDALSNALNGTTLSGSGIVPVTMTVVTDADNPLSDVATDQTVFGSSYDVWTLQASTMYKVEGYYQITRGNVSVNIGMGFTLAGGASVNWIKYTALSWFAANQNTTTTSNNSTDVSQTSATTVTTSSATVIGHIYFKGFISVNAGGTFTPFIKFSSAPGTTGSSNALKAGSWIEFTPIGSSSFTKIGNVN